MNRIAIIALPLVYAAVVTHFTAERPRIETAWGTPTKEYQEREGYLSCFDGRLRSARWTLHYLSASRIGRADGERADVRVDRSLPDEFRPSLRDYEGTALHDRGHLVPAADCAWSEQAAHDASLLSNIAPQATRLNRGPWRDLEAWIRQYVQTHRLECWCVTLPLYAPPGLPDRGRRTDETATLEWLGPNHVPIPTHWAKACLFQSGDAVELRAWALPNDAREVTRLDEYRVPVDTVEHYAGVDLWAGLDDKREAALEASSR